MVTVASAYEYFNLVPGAGAAGPGVCWLTGGVCWFSDCVD